jgi:tetratricopeptide (TPR) repeat protein
MHGAGKLRIALIAGTIVLAAGVYWLPKTFPPKKTEEIQGRVKSASAFSIEQYISDSKLKMGWNADHQVSTWEKSLNEGDADLSLYDSIGLSWDVAKVPGVAAWYFERKAGKSLNEKDWLNAAYRYFDAYKSAGDSAAAGFFVDKAISSYKEVVALNPKNLNARTDLGVLYAEGTAEPMKGILMLREVVKEDPKHENANLNLGFLSMKSGQYDKAVDRFKTVLEINPARVDMYVYLGEAYLRSGHKEKAIENFKIFKNLSNDQQMIKEVDDYIESIKNQK